MFASISSTVPSDIVAFEVNDFDIFHGRVNVIVYDDGRREEPLIIGQIAPSDAIKLARALLLAAGVEGNVDGNVTRYTFVD